MKSRLSRRICLVIGLVSTCLSGAVVDTEPSDHWVEVQKLIASDSGNFEFFGESVSIWEDTLVIGAYLDEVDHFRSGSAYVFERGPDGVWVEVQKLFASDRDVFDSFGSSVSLSGDSLIIAARDVVTDYVFERDEAGVWQEVAKLTPDAHPWSHVVALSGDTAVIGIYQDDDFTGAVFIYERDGDGNWLEVQELTGSDEDAGFGTAVAVDGDTLVVGEDEIQGPGAGPGEAYVFERTPDGAWVKAQDLAASDGDDGDGFGSSASVFDETMIVGAANDDDGGAAYIYDRVPSGEWIEVQKLKPADLLAGDSFGFSVGLWEDTAVVGARLQSEVESTSGAAYIYKREVNGIWALVQKIAPQDLEDTDMFGHSVAIYDRVILASAPRSGLLDAGAAYIYALENCSIDLGVRPAVVNPGGELIAEVLLDHRRRETVSVPLTLWIEDEAEAEVFGRLTRDLTFHYGDTIRREVSLELPVNARPGRYRLLVGVEEMQQGVVWASQWFEVVE